MSVGLMNQVASSWSRATCLGFAEDGEPRVLIGSSVLTLRSADEYCFRRADGGEPREGKGLVVRWNGPDYENGEEYALLGEFRVTKPGEILFARKRVPNSTQHRNFCIAVSNREDPLS